MNAYETKLNSKKFSHVFAEDTAEAEQILKVRGIGETLGRKLSNQPPSFTNMYGDRPQNPALLVRAGIISSLGYESGLLPEKELDKTLSICNDAVLRGAPLPEGFLAVVAHYEQMLRLVPQYPVNPFSHMGDRLGFQYLCQLMVQQQELASISV